jgi:hypothetical protein
MKKYWPRLLVSIGFLLLLSGFIYDMMFAGIPCQDPTPEMSARFNRNKHIGEVICSVGLTFFLIGSFVVIALFVVRLCRRGR